MGESFWSPGNIKILIGQGVAWLILFWIVRFTAMTLKEYIPVWLAAFSNEEEKNREMHREQLSKERHSHANTVQTLTLTFSENLSKVLDALNKEMTALHQISKNNADQYMIRLQTMEDAIRAMTKQMQGCIPQQLRLPDESTKTD